MTTPRNRRVPVRPARPAPTPDPMEEDVDVEEEDDLDLEEDGAVVEPGPAGFPALVPAASPPSRGGRGAAPPRARGRAAAPGPHPAPGAGGAHYVDDPVSRTWVIAVGAIFALLFAFAIVLGHGGLLTPLPARTPLPTAPIATAAPSAVPTAAASAASAAPSASSAATPAATIGTSPAASATP
jgi:hypothetical protein